MRLTSIAFLAFGLLRSTSAAPAVDACAKIAGKTFVAPSDARSCLKSFAFNETLRQNVLDVVSGVFDFYTYEDYYINSPAPFQESTVDIRKRLTDMRTKQYKTDYDFNMDLFSFTRQLNDGHTGWFPDCYLSFASFSPLPIVNIEVDGKEAIYVVYDSNTLFPKDFTDYLDTLGFDWKKFAGAKVVQIAGQDPYHYVDTVAKTVSSNYLDHGVRVNSVFSSYGLSEGNIIQQFGDFAAQFGVPKDSIKMTLIPTGSQDQEVVTVPYVALSTGAAFQDSKSFWAANCAAKDGTNGRDAKVSNGGSTMRRRPKTARVVHVSDKIKQLTLPSKIQPSAPTTEGATGAIRSFILPDNKTAALFVGAFSPTSPFDDPFSFYGGFQQDVVDNVKALKAAGVTRLLIDLTNNGGGFVCLGQFLEAYLSGSSSHKTYGFVSTMRANSLARKILASDIKLGVTGNLSEYGPDSYRFPNGTQLSPTYNYFEPSLNVTVNQIVDATSQRIIDSCDATWSQMIPQQPPFDLKQVAIVGNGNCASTCAQFSTAMFEKHQTPIVSFGERRTKTVEYKGMAGEQVLEWFDIDSEIKTANMKDDPEAPPDLLVSGNMRLNWRTAWSWIDSTQPIQYRSEQPTLRISYTNETFINPLLVWATAAEQVFKKSP